MNRATAIDSKTHMKPISLQHSVRLAGTFAAATVLGSLLWAQTPEKPVRGEPIKPGGGVRGEPIKAAGAGVGAGAAFTPATASAPASLGEYQAVGFDKLAGFTYQVPEYAGTNKPALPDTNQIPAAVKAYNGQTVALKGFMLPLKVEQGKVTEMLLMRDQSMCCFGSVPKINEFVTVKMVGGGTKAVMDQAVTLYGKLRVGEFMENGYLLGIYQLDGEKAAGPGL